MFLNFEDMSNIKKLYLLREAIDYLRRGIEPDYDTIDACYEDLSKCLIDYEVILDELDEAAAKNNGNLEMPADVSTEAISSAKQQFGDSYDELISQLQKLGEREKKNYLCYITEDLKDKKKLNLRIWDDNNFCYVRTYKNKQELDLNLKLDIRSNFNRNKSEVSTLKKMSKDPNETFNAEFNTKKRKRDNDNKGLDNDNK